MTRHRRTKPRRSPRPSTIVVEGVVPSPDVDHDPLPDLILGIAMDQRAFGPRKLMVAFGAYDGRFLALLYTRRTDPVTAAVSACLHHFDAMGRRGEADAAAVVLCDEPVTKGPPPLAFLDKFERAQKIAATHRVHLVDWVACDDDLFRCARLGLPTIEPGWWNPPDLPVGA